MLMEKKNTRTYSFNGKPKLISWHVILLTVLVLALCAGGFVFGIRTEAGMINSSAAEASSRLLQKSRESASEVDLSTSLRKSTVNKVYEAEAIPAYSNTQILSMDVSKPSGVTVSDLELVTQGNLVGLEDSFLKAEKDYGVNCLFVMAIASLESANGTMCFRPNNMFGFGSSGFSSKAECIDVVSKALAQNYLSPGGSLYSGKTISDVNKRYAASSTWDDKVARNMTNYYSVISAHHNKALDRLK